MIYSEPIDGMCPRCQVELRFVKAEYEQGFEFAPAYSICPSCDWKPGDTDITACDMCGDITSELVDHDGDEYCTRCHRNETFTKLSKLVFEASMRVHFETKFGIDAEFTSIHPGVQVSLFDTKDVHTRERIANTTIVFDDKYSDPIENLKAVYLTLCNIASTGKLPELKPGLYKGFKPEVMSA